MLASERSDMQCRQCKRIDSSQCQWFSVQTCDVQAAGQEKVRTVMVGRVSNC